MLVYWESRTCLYRQMKDTFSRYGKTDHHVKLANNYCCQL